MYSTVQCNVLYTGCQACSTVQQPAHLDYSYILFTFYNFNVCFQKMSQKQQTSTSSSSVADADKEKDENQNKRVGLLKQFTNLLSKSSNSSSKSETGHEAGQ